MNTRGDTLAELGQDCRIDPGAIVGLMVEGAEGPAVLGDGAVVRAGSIIYGDVRAGRRFRTGHHVLIRSHTVLGDDVLVGTGSIIDGEVEIGSQVKIETAVYIPNQMAPDNRVVGLPWGSLRHAPRYRTRQARQPSGCQGVPMLDKVPIGPGGLQEKSETSIVPCDGDTLHAVPAEG